METREEEVVRSEVVGSLIGGERERARGIEGRNLKAFWINTIFTHDVIKLEYLASVFRGCVSG